MLDAHNELAGASRHGCGPSWDGLPDPISGRDWHEICTINKVSLSVSALRVLGPILIDWLALVDGYCYVGRQRSWTWIKLDSARSVVPRKHPLLQRLSSARAYRDFRLMGRGVGRDRGGTGASGPKQLQDSECSLHLGPHLVEPVAARSRLKHPSQGASRRMGRLPE